MSARGLRRGSIAAARVVASGATYTIYGGNDGYAYAAPGSATATGVASPSDMYVGQGPSPDAYQGFTEFDTSVVVGTIVSATLSLYGVADQSLVDFTVEARLHDWGVALTTSDWVPQGSLGSKTLLASFATSGFNAAGYNVFTSDAGFVSSINQSGMTRMVLASSRQRLSNAPTGNEYVGFKSSTAAGTSQDPKLVVVTA